MNRGSVLPPEAGDWPEAVDGFESAATASPQGAKGVPPGGAIRIGPSSRVSALGSGADAGSECEVSPTLLQQADAADLTAGLNAHAVVAITDPLGKITYANDKFCTISGYLRDELLGADIRILECGDNQGACIRKVWETVARGETWRGEVKNRAKDGSAYWVAATIVPSVDTRGALRNVVAISSDITEQKRIEAEYAEKLRVQRLLADLSSRFVAAQSERIDAAIEDTQRLIVQILGLDVSLLWQFADHQENAALTHSWPPRSSAGGLGRLSSQADFPWSFGRMARGDHLCFSSIAELPPEASHDVKGLRSYGVKSCLAIPLIVNGRISGALVFAARNRGHVWREYEIIELELVAQLIGSVIGRRRAERREEQLRAELAHATRVATLGELTATLAHELNQPLAAILSNAQAARRFIAADAMAQEELIAIFDDIVRDDKRAGSIIHNLRAMVSGGPSVRESCCLNELVREVADLVHAEALGHEVLLHSTLYQDLPRVEGCRVELLQTLLNLVINAVHAMKEVPMTNRKVEIETSVDHASVVVRIRDFGPGIPPERLPHIFEPFFTTKSGGLGMGLSICRRIAETHGGRIEACASEDGGACFSLSLPISR